jgi:hypothetical protein
MKAFCLITFSLDDASFFTFHIANINYRFVLDFPLFICVYTEKNNVMDRKI